jgi:hypothetical protein
MVLLIEQQRVRGYARLREISQRVLHRNGSEVTFHRFFGDRLTKGLMSAWLSPNATLMVKLTGPASVKTDSVFWVIGFFSLWT